jgi:pimeloyl-ACP methyl ester carboxylesterase
MTQLMASAFGAPSPRAAIHASLNYPYLYTFRDVISGRFMRQLRDYRPEVPVLYVYGERKPLQFNSERWLQTLRSRPGSAVVALAESGHWVMKDRAFTRVLTEWLEHPAHGVSVELRSNE